MLHSKPFYSAVTFLLMAGLLAIHAALSFKRVVVDAKSEGHAAVGDLNGDGKNDIFLAKQRTGIYWYEYPAWTKRTIATVNYRTDDAELCDIDKDGDLDAIGIQDDDGKVAWYENNGKGAGWTKHAIGTASVGYIKDIACADYSSDGKPDIAMRGHTKTVIFVQQSPLSWQKAKTIAHATKEGMDVGDIDSDGDIDIVLNCFWLENPGNVGGNWANHTIGLGWTHNMVAIADMNNDKKLDVVFSHSNETGYPVVWFEAANPKGNWTKHIISNRVDYCQTLQAADMDNDGDIDVVTAVSGGYGVSGKENISVWLNQGNGGSFKEYVVATTGGYSLVVGDIDNDGDRDIVGERSHKAPPTEVWRNMLDPKSPVQIFNRPDIKPNSMHPSKAAKNNFLFDMQGRKIPAGKSKSIGFFNSAAILLLPQCFY